MRAIGGVLLLSVMLMLAATQDIGNQCVIGKVFEASAKKLSLTISRSRVMTVSGCTQNSTKENIKLFLYKIGGAYMSNGLDRNIQLRSIGSQKECTKGDGSIITRRMESVTRYRIVRQDRVSAVELRDFKETLLATLVSVSSFRSINPQSLEGQYSIEFPPVRLEFTRNFFVKIEGCKATKQIPPIYFFGNFKAFFFDWIEELQCDNFHQELMVDAMKSVYKYRVTDRDQCHLQFSKSFSKQHILELKQIGNSTQRKFVTAYYQLSLSGSDIPPINAGVYEGEDKVTIWFGKCRIYGVDLAKNNISNQSQYSLPVSMSWHYSNDKQCSFDYDRRIFEKFEQVTRFQFNPHTQEVTFRDARFTFLIRGEFKGN